MKFSRLFRTIFDTAARWRRGARTPQKTACPCAALAAGAPRPHEARVTTLCFALLFLSVCSYGRIVNVRDHGAVGDGSTVNTAALQKAIDECHASGGGRVLIADGNFVTGTLFLKSNVILQVETGATLSGSTSIRDYASNVFRNQYNDKNKKEGCLIFAENAENIGLEGGGKIDGQGYRRNFPNPDDPKKDRPMLIRFLRCRNVTLQNIQLLNPASWTVAMIYCQRINIHGVGIISNVNSNGDGLDFDGCEQVSISRCHFDTSDDSICLQSSIKEFPCRYITISDCIMTSARAAIRIGMLSGGDFSDITVTHCVFHHIADAALKIQLNEGGKMETFLFSNLIMKEVACAVLMTFNNYTVYVDGPTEPAPMQSMRNFTFSNFRVESKARSKDGTRPLILPLILLTGLPGHNIENLTFSNIQMIAPGGGTSADGKLRAIPELHRMRPEFTQFGKVVPAYGLYARHVRGLHLDHVTMTTELPDGRPAVICDDVAELDLADCQAAVAADAECLLRLQNARQVWIRNCRPSGGNKTFLQVEGAESRGILLSGNDLRTFEQPFTLLQGAGTDAVTTANNIK